MGIKWKSEFHSHDRNGQQSNLYTIEIIDMDIDTDPQITFKTKSLSFKGQGDKEDVYQTIITSKCTVSMEIETAGIEDFIEELAVSNEERFWLKVYRGAVTAFLGVISTEGASKEDMDFPYSFSFTALDELSRLKNKDFDALDVQTNFGASIMNYIQGIFSLTRLSEFYGTGEAFIEFYGGWHSDDASDPSGNAFDYCGWYSTAFDKIDGDKIKKAKAIDVLKQILLVQHSRIQWNMGTYIVEQLPYRAENTTMQRFAYDIDFVFRNNDTGVVYLNKTYDGINLQRLRGGKTSFLPPLKYVEIQYEHDPIDDYHIRKDNYTLGTNETGSILIANNDQKLKVEIEFNINNLNWDQASTGRKRPVVRLQIKLGSKYLKKVQTGGTIASPSFGPLTWEGSSSYFEYLPLLLDKNKTLHETFSFLTEELVNDFTLNNSYTLTVSFISLEYLDKDMVRQSIIGNYTLSDAKLFVYPTEEGTTVNEKTKTLFRTLNDNKNSQIIELKTTIGEGPADTSASGIRVKSPIWKWNVENWGDDDENILELLSKSIMAMRKRPIEILRNWRIIQTNFRPSQVMSWESKLWMALSYDYDANSETISADWLEIFFDPSGLVPEKEEFKTNLPPLTNADPVADPDTPAGNVELLPSVEFYGEFDNVIANFVTITTTVLPDPSVVSSADIKRRMHVTVSGRVAGYDTSMGFKIDYASEKVQFLALDGITLRNLRNERVELTIKPY